MLYLVPSPIGNLEDVSFRIISVLQKCELILCEDTRVSKSLIQALNFKFNLDIKIKKFIALHSHNEKEFLSNINKEFFNANVVYMSDAGMPCISDPGAVLVDFAIKNQIDYEVIPGANALLCAFASSGFKQKEFTFFAFLSNKGKNREKEIEKLMQNPYVSIVYESPTRILSLLESISLIDENRELFAIKEISKKFEKKFKASAKELLKILKNENLNGEWVLVIDSNKDEKKSFISEKDILNLDISLKEKSKLLAKIHSKNPKELYKKLLLSQS